MKTKAHIAHLKPGSAGHELRFMNRRWRALIAKAGLIVLITGVAYLPALRGGFVFDDDTLITDNQLVKASDGLPRFWLTTDASEYYPLTWSLWWLEWRLWGNSPAGYHVVNVLLHAVNAVLVWIILQRLKIPAAWLAAAVFAIHPVNVATVAWISEQKNTLSMLFYALAILLYLRFDEAGRWRWYALSLGAFMLALLSKNAVVVLSVVLLGCVWWRHSRVRWKDIRDSVPFFVLSLIFGIVNIWFEYDRVLQGSSGFKTGDFLSRLLAAGWVPWFYLYKAFLPFDLTLIYPKWDINATRWMSYAPGTILLVGLCIVLVEAQNLGMTIVIRVRLFCNNSFPGSGIFRSKLLSVFSGSRPLAVLLHRRSHCIGGGHRGTRVPFPWATGATLLDCWRAGLR